MSDRINEAGIPASEVLGKEKLDYEGYTIKNLAWLNFKKFVTYNFKRLF